MRSSCSCFRLSHKRGSGNVSATLESSLVVRVWQERTGTSEVHPSNLAMMRVMPINESEVREAATSDRPGKRDCEAIFF